MDIDETIDTFRRGQLELDCKKMTLYQNKEFGEHFEGQGYIRQTDDGALTFKLYVTRKENVKPFGHVGAKFQSGAGKLYSDEAFYDLTAVSLDGKTWKATRILPNPHWDMRDQSVIISGQMQSIFGDHRKIQQNQYLGLYFFEEYEVPLHRMSKTERFGDAYMMLDRSEFEACGSKFEVRKRDVSGETIVEATSDIDFPPGFNFRIQEALQYLTGKSAMWRARVETENDTLVLELASPREKSPRTKFWPPLSAASMEFRDCGWDLFASYLTYVVKNTVDTQWNPAAYHLYGARESSANSIDAWAVGVSVAVEAMTSLVTLPHDQKNTERTALFQKRMRECLTAQLDFADLAPRMDGLINMMGNKRPQDTLFALADEGYVEKLYVESWSYLRNRHVHPIIRDLKKPDLGDYQKLFDNIRRVEVLLHQISFYLIDYAGPYTDYGADNFPTKTYPIMR